MQKKSLFSIAFCLIFAFLSILPFIFFFQSDYKNIIRNKQGRATGWSFYSFSPCSENFLSFLYPDVPQDRNRRHEKFIMINRPYALYIGIFSIFIIAAFFSKNRYKWFAIFTLIFLQQFSHGCKSYLFYIFYPIFKVFPFLAYARYTWQYMIFSFFPLLILSGIGLDYIISLKKDKTEKFLKNEFKHKFIKIIIFITTTLTAVLLIYKIYQYPSEGIFFKFIYIYFFIAIYYTIWYNEFLYANTKIIAYAGIIIIIAADMLFLYGQYYKKSYSERTGILCASVEKYRYDNFRSFNSEIPLAYEPERAEQYVSQQLSSECALWKTLEFTRFYKYTKDYKNEKFDMLMRIHLPVYFTTNDYFICKDYSENINQVIIDSISRKNQVAVYKEDIVKKNIRLFFTEPNNDIELISFTPDIILFSVIAQEPTIFVYADGYHKYWKAYVNGKKENIIRVNNIYKGVIINKGKNILKFSFEPVNFILSLKIYYAATIIFIGFVLFYYLIKEKFTAIVN